MPKYRVQLKQGGRTIVDHIEAKSVSSVLSFYNTLTSLKVSEILKVEYSDDSLPPVDDMAYYPIVKSIISNKDTRKSVQLVLKCVKLTVDQNDIYNAVVSNLEIDNYSIDGMTVTLFKSPNV